MNIGFWESLLVFLLTVLCLFSCMENELEPHIVETREYYDDGTLLHILEDTLKNEKKIKSYHKNGNLAKEGTMIQGKHHGKFSRYYEEGTIHYTLSYSNGKKEGTLIGFHKNGVPETIGRYTDDKLDGYVHYHREDWMPKGIDLYDKGTCIYSKRYEYDSNRSLIDSIVRPTVLLSLPQDSFKTGSTFYPVFKISKMDEGYGYQVDFNLFPYDSLAQEYPLVGERFILGNTNLKNSNPFRDTILIPQNMPVGEYELYGYLSHYLDTIPSGAEIKTWTMPFRRKIYLY